MNIPSAKQGHLAFMTELLTPGMPYTADEIKTIERTQGRKQDIGAPC